MDGTLPPKRRNQRSPEGSRAPHDLTEEVIVLEEWSDTTRDPDYTRR